jgi:four helix bundle protein
MPDAESLEGIYEEWLRQAPESLRNDPLWRFEAYPRALLLFDLAWEDSKRLVRDSRGRELAGQLVRSAGSISANVDEGFGRGVEAGEYVQFLRYALGSARETRGWYFKSRHLLPADVVVQRMILCNKVIALLVTAINRRKKARHSQRSNL